MPDGALHVQIRRVELSRTGTSGAVASSLILQLLLECELEGVTRLRCAEGMLPDWDHKLFSRLEGLRILNLSSCQLSSLPAGDARSAWNPTPAYRAIDTTHATAVHASAFASQPTLVCMHEVHAFE